MEIPGNFRGWADLPALGRLDNGTSCKISRTPFLLLDDARDQGGAFLLSEPALKLIARTRLGVIECLDQARALIAQGRIVAGYLAYEAGAAFEDRLAVMPLPADGPLLWLGCFEGVTRIPDIYALLPEPAEPREGPACRWDELEHGKAVESILERVRAGDIYQANLTFQARVTLPRVLPATYCAMRLRQKAGWGGLLWTGDQWLASCSPEMFFALSDGQVEARPMKGTAARFPDPDDDKAEVRRLRSCEKERAENLMIVDLIRNDLSRISVPGTVRVPDLFFVESYPTVHQMVSRVTAELAEGKDVIDVIAAAFPCGSVTGAPKIRAMQIISEVESGPRGAYTGSLGIMLPDGSAAFNVLIRTLSQLDGDLAARLDVGSGITAGSRAASEWVECQTKLKFLSGNIAGRLGAKSSA